MSVNTPDRPRLRGFKVWLILAVLVGVALQTRSGSHNEALVFVPVGLVFAAYMIPVIVRARRDRRANGGLRPPRVTYPLAFKIAGIPVLLGAVAMFGLVLTHKDGALAGNHRSLENVLEGAMIVAVLAVAQWQRSIIRRQLGADWRTSSDANRGRG